MSILDLISSSKKEKQISNEQDRPDISMDTFQRFKDRLIEQYLHDPKFHAIVDNLHCSIQNGDITSEALFGAIFLAKEMFIQNHEDRIRDDIKYERKNHETSTA